MIKVFSSGQSVYSVTIEGRQRGMISNETGPDGRATGRWKLYEMDGRNLVARDPVDVTNILHNTADLHRAISTYLGLVIDGMTADTLRRFGEAMYGPRWQSDLASDIGVSDRTMRRWAVAGCAEGPAGDIRRIATERRDALATLLG